MATPAELRRVYLACRPIFSENNNAQVRKAKKVKELVTKSEASLQPLLKEIGKERLVEVTRVLLESRVFESELRAKVKFPELFLPSTSRDAHRQASEIDAAQSTAEALYEITSRDGNSSTTEEVDVEEGDVVIKEEVEPAVQNDQRSIPDEKRPSLGNMPSLYPSYLPYRTQHAILTKTQQVLEECCFDFATTAMPLVLDEKRWDCPAAVELTKWMKIFRNKEGEAPINTLKTDIDFNGLQDILIAVLNIRHTAVHRLPTTARGVSKLLESAVRLAQILQDDLRAMRLEEVRSELDSKIRAMELNKNVLEDAVSAGLHEIQRQREELDRREKDLIEGMVRDDAENKALVGKLLEEHTQSMLGGAQSAWVVNDIKWNLMDDVRKDKHVEEGVDKGDGGEGKEMDGKEIEGEEVKGKEIEGKEIEGEEVKGKEIEGKEIEGEEIGGKETEGNEMDGKETGGDEVKGREMEGEEMEGEQVKGKEMEGKEAKGKGRMMSVRRIVNWI